MYGLALLWQENLLKEKYRRLHNYVEILGILNATRNFKQEMEINNIPQPITDSTHEHNCKSRLVYCQNCKYELTTSLPGPKCGICHSWLITSIR